MSVALGHARRHPRSRLAGTLALILVLAACSSPSASPNDGAGGGENQISLAGTAFSPETITIAVGETIEFTNDDGRSHRIVEGENGTEVSDPAFEAVSLASGDTGGVTFTEAGTYQLTCTIHSSMAMTVIVE